MVQFLETLKYFTEIAPVVLSKTASETDPNALSIYAGAFANAGLIAVSKELVGRIKSLEGLTSKSAIHILRVCSEFPTEFSELAEKVLAYLAINPPTSASETIDLAYY